MSIVSLRAMGRFTRVATLHVRAVVRSPKIVRVAFSRMPRTRSTGALQQRRMQSSGANSTATTKACIKCYFWGVGSSAAAGLAYIYQHPPDEGWLDFIERTQDLLNKKNWKNAEKVSTLVQKCESKNCLRYLQQLLKGHGAFSRKAFDQNDLLVLGQALKSNINPSVNKLSLSRSSLPRPGFTGFLRRLTSNTSVSVLDLSYKNVSQQGERGYKIWSEEEINALITLIENSSSLTHINLAFSDSGSMNAERLAEAVQSNSNIQKLNLRGWKVNELAKEHIIEMLGDRVSL